MKAYYTTVEIKGFTFAFAVADGKVIKAKFLPEQADEIFAKEFEKEGIEAERNPFVLQKFVELLKNYARGEKVALEKVPVFMSGSSHDIKVYEAIRRLSFGQIATYGEIARIVGSSARAVGRALARNRIPLFIPCHRVIRSDGNLGGFTPSVEIKKLLLELEGFSP